MPVIYNETKSSDFLSDYILNYWEFAYFSDTKQIFEHIVLPNAYINIIFSYHSPSKKHRSFLFGPRLKPENISVNPNTKYIGIRLRPCSYTALFKKSAYKIRNQSVPLEEIVAKEFIQEFEHILEEENLDFLRINNVLKTFILETIDLDYMDPYIAKVEKYISKNFGNIKISDCYHGIPYSERTFQRIIKYSFGFTLKEYARLIRFRHTIRKIIINNKPIQDSLLNYGYFDQAHFSKEVSNLSGIPPTLFKKIYSQIEHHSLLDY